MEYVVCNSEDSYEKDVTEDFRHGNDFIIVPIRTLVCSSCGERYYSKQAVRKMEEIEKQIEAETLPVKTVGKVMLAG